MFAGFPGVFTVIKPNAFSISINERVSFKSQISQLVLISFMLGGGINAEQLARKAMIECEDYNCAVKMIGTSVLVKPIFFIVAGIGRNEGVVISRDRIGIDNIDELSDEKWFLL